MKKVLIVDWLDRYGGTERVIKSLHNVFRFNKCYALVNIMRENDLKKIFGNDIPPIITTKLSFFGKNFRYFLPFFPYFIKCVKPDSDTDLIISSSHAVAKYVTTDKSLHISYFQARNLRKSKTCILKELRNFLKYLFPTCRNLI